MNYQYKFEPYSGSKSRYTCPRCKREKTFTRYINQDTGEHIASEVGRCNREIECGYHYKPKQYFEDNGRFSSSTPRERKQNNIVHSEKQVSFIDPEIWRQTLTGFDKNNFTKFLRQEFGERATNEIICKYFLGTSSHWSGATIFWQGDTQGKIRAGKIMLYNPETGKRVKEPFNHITWTHKVLGLQDFNLSQSFFGEHLITGIVKDVGIVESEKTAIIASIFFPALTWIASGGLGNLNPERCHSLKGKNVILFPDLGAFDKWQSKANELKSSGLEVEVSRYLEKVASDEDRKRGLDLADYLLRPREAA